MIRLLLVLLLVASPALAQQNRSRRAPPPAPPPPKEEPAPPPVVEPPPAPYEPELLRLSEIVGSLAFLRDLCNEPDAREWPQRMQALIETEGTTPGRRERLAGAYNRGFRGFALTYRTCTPAANVAAQRYLREGERLSSLIAGRYGG